MPAALLSLLLLLRLGNTDHLAKSSTTRAELRTINADASQTRSAENFYVLSVQVQCIRTE
jgi:hypothetical protein